MTDEPSSEQFEDGESITGYCFAHAFYTGAKCPACSEYMAYCDAMNDMAEDEASRSSYAPPEGFQLVNGEALLRLVNAVDELVGAMCDLLPD